MGIDDDPRAAVNRYALLRDGSVTMPIASCFAPGAEITFGEKQITGLTAIENWIAASRSRSVTQHHITTCIVTPGEDGSVSVISYALVVEVESKSSDGGGTWLASVEYRDQLVRTEGGWRIVTRAASVQSRCRLMPSNLKQHIDDPVRPSPPVR